MKIRTIAENRKEIVKVISDLTNTKAEYLGPPTFSYKIGAFTVDRDGTVEIMYQDIGETMKYELAERGLAESDADSLLLNVPLENHTAASLKNLVFMIHSKQCLINRAVGKTAFKINGKLITTLEEKDCVSIDEFIKVFEENKVDTFGFSFIDEKIHFDGFPYDLEKIGAFTELVTLMSGAAINQKRVSPKETIEENEKYYMRVWLVRLGLGGQGGKDTRRILLKNLKGHTAFRTEEEKERAKEKSKVKRVDDEE